MLWLIHNSIFYRIQMNIICFLLLVGSMNIYAQKPTKSIVEKFEENLHLGFKFHDDRKQDSAKLFLIVLDSLIQTTALDSSHFYRKETLEATLLVKENKTAESVQKLLKALTIYTQNKDSSKL